MHKFDVAELEELVAYEVFLVAQSYGIIGQPLTKRYSEIFEYPYDGSDPRRTHCGYIDMKTGDWRDGFLNVGGPLIFASSFKILDLIVEWILGSESRTKNNGALQFYEKIKLLKKSERTWPDFLYKNEWLKDRFIALYEGLFPYRNTIIHSSRFSSKAGGVIVEPSEGKGSYGAPVSINSKMIGHIAYMAVALAKILQGTWKFDLYINHRLHWSVNMLHFLHKLPLDSCTKPPAISLVRIHRDDAPSIRFSTEKIASELNAPMMVSSEELGNVDMRQNYALFDLEIIIRGKLDQDRVYLIPFTSINLFKNEISLEGLAEFKTVKAES